MMLQVCAFIKNAAMGTDDENNVHCSCVCVKLILRGQIKFSIDLLSLIRPRFIIKPRKPSSNQSKTLCFRRISSKDNGGYAIYRSAVERVGCPMFDSSCRKYFAGLHGESPSDLKNATLTFWLLIWIYRADIY